MKTLLSWTEARTCEDLRSVFCFDDSRNSSDYLLEGICLKCNNRLLVENRLVHVPSEGQDDTYLSLQFKNCSSCNSHALIWCCKKWIYVDDLLDSVATIETRILKKATVPKDYVIIYLLGQICHNLHDLNLSLTESPVGYGNFHFTFKVLLQDGHAKGFCIVKEKEEQLVTNKCQNFFPTIDFLYIRKKYRNKGFGSLMLQNLLEENHGKDLYFSLPISFSLSKILISRLERSASLRNKLWGIDGEIQERFSIYYYLMSG